MRQVVGHILRDEALNTFSDAEIITKDMCDKYGITVLDDAGVKQQLRELIDEQDQGTTIFGVKYSASEIFEKCDPFDFEHKLEEMTSQDYCEVFNC